MKFIKKKAECVAINYFQGERFPEYRCPNIPCGMHLQEEYNYCPYCGQRIVCIKPKEELKDFSVKLQKSQR